MGEANIKSARGQYDEAVKMCEWIIRNGQFVGNRSHTARTAHIADPRAWNALPSDIKLI